jgi:hypothetical protein
MSDATVLGRYIGIREPPSVVVFHARKCNKGKQEDSRDMGVNMSVENDRTTIKSTRSYYNKGIEGSSDLSRYIKPSVCGLEGIVVTIESSGSPASSWRMLSAVWIPLKYWACVVCGAQARRCRRYRPDK